MCNTFSNILVPVDLSINTELAVKKAVELSNFGTTIHLLHIQTVSTLRHREPTDSCPGVSRDVPGNENIYSYLTNWKLSIESFGDNLKVTIWIVMNESVQNAIQEKAIQLNVGLIVIGKNSYHFRLPFLNTVTPNKIVKKTGIPVLTVKPGSFDNKTRKVIIPISSDIFKDKMQIISMISKKIKIKIYLVTFLNNGMRQPGINTASLLQAYKWIKSEINCTVDYAVLTGRNRAKSILNYADKIDADFLLLYLETESRIGWLNRHISDLLPPSTKVEIFTIQRPQSQD